ncbi:TPA: hypothetical protein ACLQU7_005640 [Bacillus tropicus]|uniref:hypothetical protein n=1 Tax=Bacillus cereus group TaxID=86661 RepID=UPI00003CB641|nr:MULTISPECIES: hypothetical protein [Bacillus cereus group]AIY73039.1 hypothetical protein NT98_5850 [Bacillus cereus]AJI07949.1 hypothetical protein AQ16_5533 [Bacillus cereus G9241]EAL16092.1 hypothetical protein protein [Bacillus cereus G9241]QPS53575.1 hypothetical protein I6G54_28620 [Bacillus tropicus]
MARKERTVLDNPPSDETALKMAGFFMRTLVSRILAARKAEEEAEKAGGMTIRINKIAFAHAYFIRKITQKTSQKSLILFRFLQRMRIEKNLETL